jgi:EPS-associated MarR family transcriptional regulator
MAEDLLTDREEASFRVLRELERKPGASQRELAQRTRISLGAVNYCLRALQDKGLIKVQNFRASDNKLRYAYNLTPSGIAERLTLTRRFLARKIAEYEALQAEIDEVRREVGEE